MVGSPVLGDSSFCIGLLRRGQDPLRALALAASERDLAVCGVVRCEVARRLQQPRTLKRFQAFWNVMVNVPTDNRLWDEVERTAWQLDRKGLMLPLTDVIIACCALRIGAVLPKYDAYFPPIPGLRLADRFGLY